MSFMEHALALAAPGLGRVWPNPTVGCVIVRDGEIVGSARTADGGRPHAEVLALGAAGGRARGATVHVTLEPCHHFGKSPPCTRALWAAGVARIEIAVEDPDPRVNGAGIAALRAAGIEVEVGANAEAARRLNAGFFSRIIDGRPLVFFLDDPDDPHCDAKLVSVAGLDRHAPAHDREVTIVFDPDLELLDVLPSLTGAGGTFVLTRRGSHAARGGRGPLELPPAVEVVELGGGQTLDLPGALHELGLRGLTRIGIHRDESVGRRLQTLGLVSPRE